MSQLVGHKATCSQLATLWQNQKWPHGLMLAGIQGIGKRALVDLLVRRILAGAIDGSTEGFPTNYDQSSAVIAQLKAGSCPDVQYLIPPEGKQAIKVDQVREALQKLALSASRDYRFCVIDAADQLTNAAANVLLKTLEEPANHLYFILITHQPAKLLPTIRSRCRIVNCSPLSPSETKQILIQQWPDLTPAEVDKLALLAGGSPGSVLMQEREVLKTYLASTSQTELLSKLPANKTSVWLISRLFVHSLRAVGSHEQPAVAELYQRWQKDLATQQEYNLSLPWLFEQYRHDFKNLLHS